MNDQGFIKYLQGKNLAPRSIETYLEYLTCFQTWLDEVGKTSEEVVYAILLDYIKSLRAKGHKGRSINSQLGAIRHWFNYLQAQKVISDNPAAGLYVRDARNRLPHDLLSSKELAELYFNYPQDHPKKVRNRQILGFLVFQGLRTAEVAALQKSDVDLEKGMVRILGSRKAAGRLLELNIKQAQELIPYLNSKSEGLLFTTSTGGDPQWVITPLLYQLKKNKLITGTNQLRASVIANWLKTQGLRQVQYLAGHRYVSSTERYLKADPDKLKKVVLSTHPLDF